MFLHKPLEESLVNPSEHCTPLKNPCQNFRSDQPTDSETPTSHLPGQTQTELSKFFSSLFKSPESGLSGKISETLCFLTQKFESMLRQKDHKISKLENSLEYFYQKFIKAKQKLNLLSKNLVKIKDFEKQDSFSKDAAPLLDKPVFLKKNSANLAERKSANHEILQSIIGAKSYVNQRKSSQALGIESVLSLHRTFDHGAKPSLYEGIRSFETEKQNFKIQQSNLKEKRSHSPLQEEKIHKRGKSDLTPSVGYLGIRKEEAAKTSGEGARPKKAETGRENVVRNMQVKKVKTEAADPREALGDTSKKTLLFKKKKTKLSLTNSKKMCKSSKKNTYRDSNKHAFFYKNKKAKEKKSEKGKSKNSKRESQASKNKSTANKNVSRKQCLSAKTSIHKLKTKQKNLSKKNMDNGIQRIKNSKTKNLKYSSSDQKIGVVKNAPLNNEIFNFQTPIIGVEKLKFPKYLKALQSIKSKNKDRLVSGKKKKTFKDLHLASNLRQFQGKDKQSHLQNIFLNKNSSSLKNFKNGFNNLHLNYLFSKKNHLENDQRVGFELNSIFSKQTPKGASGKVAYKRKSS